MAELAPSSVVKSWSLLGGCDELKFDEPHFEALSHERHDQGALRLGWLEFVGVGWVGGWSWLGQFGMYAGLGRDVMWRECGQLQWSR